MVDDDPIDDIRGVAMTAGTAISRVAETVIRQMQDRKRLAQQGLERAGADAQARYAAQRELAERHFIRARHPDFLEQADPRAVAQTWHAAQQWKGLEPARFTEHAEALNSQFRDRFGVDLEVASGELGSREDAEQVGQFRVEQVREVEHHLEREREEAHEAQRLIRDAEAKETMAQTAASNAERELLIAQAEDHRRDAAAAQATSQDHREQADTVAARVPAQVSAAQRREPADRTPTVPETVAVPAQRPGAPEYDTPERRAATDRALADAGVPDQARKARMTSDQMNGRDPREAARPVATKKKAAARPAQVGRSRDAGRSR